MMARLRDNVTDTAFTPAEKQRRYRERQRTKPAATVAALSLADPGTMTLRQLQGELVAMKAAVHTQLARIAALSKEIHKRLPPSKGGKPV